MRTHVIVQSLGVCVLLVWTTVWDVPVSDAGGPPVRLAIGRQRSEHSEDQFPDAKDLKRTQLIPTQIGERTAQLIPTEVEPGSVLEMKAVRDVRLIASNFPRTVCNEIDGFLDPHLQHGPCPLNQTPWTVTPWNVTRWTEWKYFPKLAAVPATNKDRQQLGR